jgi:radical SAM superfamily enzyme YgiQ (UPF0313 family)
MMRVLLLSTNTFLEPHPVYPLGLDYVARAVAASHQVRILDANLLAGDEALGKAVREFAPHAVGISLRNVDNADSTATQSFLESSRRMVDSVRLAAGDVVTVVLGGSGFSLFPTLLLEELQADYGIIGEGERLADLLSALEQGDRDPALPGVVVRGRPPEPPVPLPGRPVRQDPGRNGHTPFYVNNGGILNLQTKRGCPFQCIYCTYPLLEGERMRLFDPVETGRTARMLEEAGASFLYVTDSVFNAHEEHSLAVAESMREAGVSIPWGGFFSPRTSSPDYFTRLARCGCTHVEFGTESLNGPMLRTYRKPFSPRDVLHAHERAQEAGLFVSHYFLLGGPGETESTVRETLERIEELPRSVFFFFCGIRVHPGTRVHAMALEEGSIGPEEPLLDPVFYTPRAISLAGINEQVDAEARGRANWITPRAAERLTRITRRLYALGHTGVLWERMVR